MLHDHDDESLAVPLRGVAVVPPVGHCGCPVMLVLTEMESAIEFASNALALQEAHKSVWGHIRNQSFLVIPALEIVSKAVRNVSRPRAESASAVARAPAEILVVATEILI